MSSEHDAFLSTPTHDSMVEVIKDLRRQLFQSRSDSKFWQDRYLILHKKIEDLGLHAGQVLNKHPPDADVLERFEAMKASGSFK